VLNKNVKLCYELFYRCCDSVFNNIKIKMRRIIFISVFITFLFLQTSTVAQESNERQTEFIIQSGYLFRMKKDAILYYSPMLIEGAIKFDAIYGNRSFSKNPNAFLGIGFAYRYYVCSKPDLSQQEAARNYSNTLAILANGKFDFPIDLPLANKNSLYLSSSFGLSVNDYHGNLGLLFNLSAGVGIGKIHIGPVYEAQFNAHQLWHFSGVNIGITF